MPGSITQGVRTCNHKSTPPMAFLLPVVGAIELVEFLSGAVAAVETLGTGAGLAADAATLWGMADIAATAAGAAGGAAEIAGGVGAGLLAGGATGAAIYGINRAVNSSIDDRATKRQKTSGESSAATVPNDPMEGSGDSADSGPTPPPNKRRNRGGGPARTSFWGASQTHAPRTPCSQPS